MKEKKNKNLSPLKKNHNHDVYTEYILYISKAPKFFHSFRDQLAVMTTIIIIYYRNDDDNK